MIMNFLFAVGSDCLEDAAGENYAGRRFQCAGIVPSSKGGKGETLRLRSVLNCITSSLFQYTKQGPLPLSLSLSLSVCLSVCLSLSVSFCLSPSLSLSLSLLPFHFILCIIELLLNSFTFGLYKKRSVYKSKRIL